ncbi:MAG: TerB family tellurite resistance protein [Gammaproteobacteria bacterium]
MHIILGALGSIVTILWLLHRLNDMGVSLGGLNPWLWQRRRRWRSQYDANPVFQIDRPLEATALLLTAVAKADGDMSAQAKTALLDTFEQEFKLSANDASSLLRASVHLLGAGNEVNDNLSGVMAPSVDAFTDEQWTSVQELLERIAKADGSPSVVQRDLLAQIGAFIAQQQQPSGKWD